MEQMVVRIADAIRTRAAGRHAFVFALSGPDAAGKTTMAEAVVNALAGGTYHVAYVAADWFHFPREYRRESPGTPPEQFLHHTIDFDRLVEEVLEPTRDGADRVTFERFDVDRNEGHPATLELPDPTILVVEGVFLLQPKLMPYVDFSVYLRAARDEILDRAVGRDADRELFREVDDLARRYREKYLPGQELHRELHDPEALADWVVDNTDYEQPVVVHAAEDPG